ncbi:MAG TPA: amino acid ABC transporter permease [Acidimicrobiales bacterium]|nr:amino acid ABC transporter permease [Acidimicrobiales bacterium]
MSTNGDDSMEVVPVRHIGRWFGGAVMLVLLAMFIHTLLSKPDGKWRFSWNVVGQYFFSTELLHGLLVTIELTVISMTIGIVLGVIIAILRLSPSRLLSTPAWTYTWFFRGTPVYVQLLFWFNIAALYQHFSIGVPFWSHAFLTINSNSIFTPFTAAFVAFGLNEAAYMSEIARAGLIAVDEGQIEAATSLGMTRGQSLRLVILPQAMRVVIPPTGNEVISMLKTTSLAAAISVQELLGAAVNIYSVTYEVMGMLITASLWYLTVTTVLSIGQFYLERHFAKGALRTPPPTPIQRIRSDLRGIAEKFPSSHRRTNEMSR